MLEIINLDYFGMSVLQIVTKMTLAEGIKKAPANTVAFFINIQTGINCFISCDLLFQIPFSVQMQ